MAKSSLHLRLIVVLWAMLAGAALADLPKRVFLPVGAANEKSLDLELQGACAAGAVDKIGPLLDKGAALEAGDADGETPLMFAALNGRVEAVNLLLAKGAKINALQGKGFTALGAGLRARRSRCGDAFDRQGGGLQSGG